MITLHSHSPNVIFNGDMFTLTDYPNLGIEVHVNSRNRKQPPDVHWLHGADATQIRNFLASSDSGMKEKALEQRLRNKFRL